MYHLLKRLSRRHEITLVSYIRKPEETDQLKHLGFLHDVHTVMRGRAWQPKYYMRALTTRYPFLVGTYVHSTMAHLLRDLTAKTSYQLIHVEPFYALPDGPDCNLPLVVSEHNIEYTVYGEYVRRFPMPLIRPFLSLDVGKLRFWEQKSWKRAASITAVSSDDAAVIGRSVKHHVTIIPNGVDVTDFPFRTAGFGGKGPNILFVGNFRWLPNREAADTLVQKIFPAIRTKLPDASLTVAGMDIPGQLMDRVTALGGTARRDVDDIPALYREADMLVAPHAIAGGTKFKMLEAMASGLPIVTTKEGVAGLSMKRGVHYEEAHNPEAFAEAVTSLWKHPSRLSAMAKRALALVEDAYNWDTIADSLERVWRETYETHRKTS